MGDNSQPSHPLFELLDGRSLTLLISAIAAAGDTRTPLADETICLSTAFLKFGRDIQVVGNATGADKVGPIISKEFYKYMSATRE